MLPFVAIQRNKSLVRKNIHWRHLERTAYLSIKAYKTTHLEMWAEEEIIPASQNENRDPGYDAYPVCKHMCASSALTRGGQLSGPGFWEGGINPEILAERGGVVLTLPPIEHVCTELSKIQNLLEHPVARFLLSSWWTPFGFPNLRGFIWREKMAFFLGAKGVWLLWLGLNSFLL